MIFERQFVLAGRGLAAVGVLALAVTREVGIAYAVLALASLVWTGVRGWHGKEYGLGSTATNLATAAAISLIFAPVVFRGAPPIGAIAEFLLVLTALRTLAAQTNRDWVQVYALSFFQLVAASALTVEPIFALLFLAYLLLAPWALVLFLLRREMTDAALARRLAEEPFVDPSLFRSVASVTIVLFLSTILVFVFFPRMGAGFFANPLSTGAGLTGFSDEVGLGDVTALKSDQTVAMRVTIDHPERLQRRPTYWRGAALDSFDGRRWTRARHELRPLARTGPGLFLTREGARPRKLLRQEVILEPLENPTIFFLGVPLQIQGRFTAMMMDALGDLRAVPSTTTRIRYDVVSSLEPRNDPPTPRSRRLPNVDPRVSDLARRVAEGASGDVGRAEALLQYFRRGFQYSTAPGDPGDRDPLAWFLLETKTGHCEYFASSLAVMLRAVGIPSLVVNGYLGGEWNPYGEYFVVRQSDAHSWVEAYVDGQWRLLDPTPPSGQGGARSGFQGLGALLDSYRMRWYRYVVNYTFEDQIGIAFSLRDSSRRLWRGFRGELWRDSWERLRGDRSEGKGPGLAPIGAVIVAAAAVWLWRRRRRSSQAAEITWATERYLALLRVLEQRGLRKRPADTPDEFYHRIESELDGDRELVERFTELYQDARFSGFDRPERRAELESLLGDLERRG